MAPRDIVHRRAAAFATTARLTEGAPAGCLVPARLAWLTGERCRSQARVTVLTQLDPAVRPRYRHVSE